MEQKIYITKQGAETLRQEYEELFRVERPKVVETVAWAASNGDRSENGDYIYGKKRLREIDRRLRFISKRLEAAEVVDVSQVQSDRIVFGATVELEDEDGSLKVYQIVGEDEIEVNQGKISWKSPMGRSLLGKKEGDEVLLHRPNGDLYFTVISFKFV